MGLIIQDKLNEIEILMPKVDVVFIPDIHPDGLLLHYSTTYKYNSELEDFFLSNNSFIVSTKITTYLRKEYGVIDLNDTMYGDNFKEWPLFVWIFHFILPPVSLPAFHFYEPQTSI